MKRSFTFNNKYYEYDDDQLTPYRFNDYPEELISLYDKRFETIKRLESLVYIINKNKDQGKNIDYPLQEADYCLANIQELEGKIIYYKEENNIPPLDADLSNPIDPSLAPVHEDQMKFICPNCESTFDSETEFENTYVGNESKRICPNCKKPGVIYVHIYSHYGDIHSDLGRKYMTNENLNQSIEEFLSAINYYSKIDKYYNTYYDYGIFDLALCYQNIGRIYYTLKEYSTSLPYLDEAISRWEYLLSKDKVSDYDCVAIGYFTRASSNFHLTDSSFTEYENITSNPQLSNTVNNIINDLEKSLYYDQLYINNVDYYCNEKIYNYTSETLASKHSNYESSTIFTYITISYLSINLNELSKAKDYLNKANQLIKNASYLSANECSNFKIDLKNLNTKLNSSPQNHDGNTLNSNNKSKSSNANLISSDRPSAPPKKEGCYIATAVYGDYNCPQVLVLRNFRDTVLQKSFFGRSFIKIYYALSPSLAKKLKKSTKINKLVKQLLDKFIRTLSE